MRTKDFDYHLPGNLIAQQPAEPRDSCRLLVMDRENGTCRHTSFRNLTSFLRQGDLLVFNDTRVIPARIFTRKKTGSRCEVFFLEQADGSSWKALVRPGRRIYPGTILRVEENPSVVLLVTAALTSGERLITVAQGCDTGLAEVMDRYGHVPLPHYIGRKDTIADRRT
jgi:S-adenosylmethionine:tRNA ribosyltransferase-isomerase